MYLVSNMLIKELNRHILVVEYVHVRAQLAPFRRVFDQNGAFVQNEPFSQVWPGRNF